MSTFWIATVIMLLGSVVAFWLGRNIREGTRVPPFAGCLITIIGAGSVIVAMRSFIWEIPRGNVGLAVGLAFCVILYSLVAAYLYRPLIAALVGRAFDSFLYGYADIEEEGTYDLSIAQKFESEEAYLEAVGEYKNALRKDPNNLDARFGLAGGYYKMEAYAKAALEYEGLLRRAGDLDMHRHCIVMTRLADLSLIMTDNVERARYWLEQIVRTYPESKYAKFAQRRMRRIDAHDDD